MPVVDVRPIGVFDSGFGGLTVARALIDLLPGEPLVYFGDTARYPYGPRSATQIQQWSGQIAELLVSVYDIRALVVACNTASATAIDLLAAAVPVPVVGVIGPGVRAAAATTETGRVGVIGTVTTVSSGAYQRSFEAYAPEVELTCAACPGFVEFVERDETDSDQVLVLAERLLAPVIEADVDTLLLGCTHYPFLARTISKVMGQAVTLVSSAEETAFDVRSRLVDARWPARRNPNAIGEHRWISSGSSATFAEIGARLLGPELSAVLEHRWEA